MAWTVRVGEENYEAASIEILQQWIAEGRVKPESLVYQPSKGEWVQVRNLPELKVSKKPPIPKKKGLLNAPIGCFGGCLIVLVLFVVIAVLIAITSAPPSTSSSSSSSRPDSSVGRTTGSEWIKPAGHFYTGVKLYVGMEDGGKELVGTVLGGNDNYVNPATGERYRAVKIAFESGRVEWRDRMEIGAGPTWWVRRDDPAISRGVWKIYDR